MNMANIFNDLKKQQMGNPSTHQSNTTGGKTMIITTTPSIEGRTITAYHGIVFGEVVLGMNVFKDMFSGLRDFFGGRSGTYEKGLADARHQCLAELEQRAAKLGANAVVGIDVDYEVLGETNGMLMVTASGTAVTIS